MRLKRVTCPETAHLETIELEDHPLGVLIAGCSRFQPESEPTCSRRCAELLDRRRARSKEAPGELDEGMLACLDVGDRMRLDLDLDACAAARRDS
jgi:hypothetical protein